VLVDEVKGLEAFIIRVGTRETRASVGADSRLASNDDANEAADATAKKDDGERQLPCLVLQLFYIPERLLSLRLLGTIWGE
jgi:hypothetical protein